MKLQRKVAEGCEERTTARMVNYAGVESVRLLLVIEMKPITRSANRTSFSAAGCAIATLKYSCGFFGVCISVRRWQLYLPPVLVHDAQFRLLHQRKGNNKSGLKIHTYGRITDTNSPHELPADIDDCSSERGPAKSALQGFRMLLYKCFCLLFC